MGGSGRSLLVVVVASGSVFALFLIVFRVQLVTVVPFCPPSLAMTTRVVFFAGTPSNGAASTPAALRKLWRGGGQEDHTSPPRKVDAKKHGAPHHPKPKATGGDAESTHDDAHSFDLRTAGHAAPANTVRATKRNNYGEREPEAWQRMLSPLNENFCSAGRLLVFPARAEELEGAVSP